MKLLDKYLESKGFFKAQRIGEIMTGKQSGLDFSLLGRSDVSQYEAYLKTYADVEWIYACVYTIANAIAGLPFRIYKDGTKDGEIIKIPVTSGDAYNFLKKPNVTDPSLTWYNILEMTVASMELTGNAYWLSEGDSKAGNIVPMISSRVRAIPETDTEKKRFVKQYVYIPAGGMEGNEKNPKYEPQYISHFKYMNPSNYIYGLSSLSACRLSKDTYKFMTQANMNIFRKASLTDLFLKTDKVLNDKVYDRLLKNFQAKHTGVDEAHAVGILEQGLDIKEVRQNLRDLEYNEGRRITREEICSVFNVPPLLVGILDKATYSNYKESIKIFYQLCIIPKLKRIEPTITNLVSKYDPSLYAEADLSGIEALRDDEKVKAEIAKIYFDMGMPVKTINKKLNMNIDEYDGWEIGYLPVALMPAGGDRTPDEGTPPEPPKAIDDLIPYRKTLGANWKVEKWHRYTAITEKIERGYMKIIRGFFFDQRDAIAKRLEAKKDFTTLTPDELKAFTLDAEYAKYAESAKAKVEKAGFEVDTVLFNEAGEIKRWASASRKVHGLSLEESARHELIMLAVTTSFNMNSDSVINWLDKYGMKRATDVIGTARAGIREQLVEGLKAGESIAELKKRLVEYYDGYAEEKWKALRVARTEVMTASNQGNLEAYKQSGVVEKKGWLGEPDARDTHLLAQRTYDESGAIPLNEKFEVGGDSMIAPGQGSDPAQVINCRCTLFAVLKRRED
jgi:HK97 family phage portal protein